MAVICSLLGVPRTDTQRLLDWSHAIVKMYELTTSDDERAAATSAAQEFMDYTAALIADKRAQPDDLLVAALATVEDEGDRLSDAEIISTVIVLLNAGHEATVNTLGNGMRAFLLHPDQWRRVKGGEVPARVAIEEMIRWDAPLQLFERWVLDDGVEIAGRAFTAARRWPCSSARPTATPAASTCPSASTRAGATPPTSASAAGSTSASAPHSPTRSSRYPSAQLARLVPDLQLAAPPAYHPTFVIRGLQALLLETGGG